MRYRLPLFVIMLVVMQAQAGRKLSVLFIGNSYTHFNNMPQLVANFAASMGDTLLFDSYAIDGASFADHITLSGCIQKIQSANWDLVVLQEQSLKPAKPTGTFFNDSYHSAGILDTMIEDSDPCTEKMFFMTWGRKNGDSSLLLSTAYLRTTPTRAWIASSGRATLPWPIQQYRRPWALH